ncbi:uncharacterized protein LOC135074832 [Ostrinia nubilalis]|uniref:uncharacterized protein LOC135074832 n=1 Tax=Ostrinia nubilalis TaxID=29057 RepID=UPI0030822080
MSPSPYSATGEFIFIEVNVKGIKAVLGVVYCPPGVDYLPKLESALEPISADYIHHLIMGDFNTNLLVNSSSSTKLTSLVTSLNLSILPLQATHHNIDSPDTLLDLVITSAPDSIIAHGQCPAPGFSRHDLVYASYRLHTSKQKLETVLMRSMSKVDADAIRRDAASLDWDQVVSATTIDDKVAVFNSNLLTLYDVHAPLRLVKLKRPPAPWISKGVRMAMTRRDRAFHNYKRDRSDINWCKYKAARNRCNQVVRSAKRRHIHDNIIDASSADVWKFLKTLGIGKNPTKLTHSSFSGDDLNTHFSSASVLDPLIRSQTISEVTSTALLVPEVFVFSAVSDDGVRKIIHSIKSKAVGVDDISRLTKPRLRFATNGNNRRRYEKFHTLQHHISNKISNDAGIILREANLPPGVRCEEGPHLIPVC